MSVVVVMIILDLMVCFVVFHSGVSCCVWGCSQPKKIPGVAYMTRVTKALLTSSLTHTPSPSKDYPAGHPESSCGLRKLSAERPPGGGGEDECWSI